VCLELGGNAPFIVFADADLEQAVEDLVALKKANSGQVCVTANRVFIEASIFNQFAERLCDRYGNLIIGDGFDSGTEQGPLISSEAADRVDGLVQEAIADGANAICGGKRSTLGPNFYPPTILTSLSSKSRLLAEEVFGPVLPLIPFHTDDEVIVAANATEHRLAAYAYTTNLRRADRLARELEFGVVGLNDPRPITCEAPFGGIRFSGLGREGGREGLLEFMDSKLIGMRI
jgi:succinate-semialdehyde dehydrogenase/glutarate-semialdehyde dehydrogenase